MCTVLKTFISITTLTSATQVILRNQSLYELSRTIRKRGEHKNLLYDKFQIQKQFQNNRKNLHLSKTYPGQKIQEKFKDFKES